MTRKSSAAVSIWIYVYREMAVQFLTLVTIRILYRIEWKNNYEYVSELDHLKPSLENSIKLWSTASMLVDSIKPVEDNENIGA